MFANLYGLKYKDNVPSVGKILCQWSFGNLDISKLNSGMPFELSKQSPLLHSKVEMSRDYTRRTSSFGQLTEYDDS